MSYKCVDCAQEFRLALSNYRWATGREDKDGGICDTCLKVRRAFQSFPEEGAKLIYPHEREECAATWINDGRPVCIMPLKVMAEYIGAVDVAFGRDYLWDGKKWHSALRGVFLQDVIFVTDYYGYPDGAIFRRCA